MTDPAPATHAFLVPDDLLEHDQWVLWRYVTRKGRPTKVPFQVSGDPADISSCGTWTSFVDAENVWRRNRQSFDGLGFVFSRDDSFTGIDLDDSLDEQGRCKVWARGVVERFSDTYTEISPSGQGLKIWARGLLPANLPGVQVRDGSIELYDHARYFTVTGRPFRGAPLQIEDHAADILELYKWAKGSGRRAVHAVNAKGRIPYGLQHLTLVSICGTLRRRGLCDEAIEACLQVVNNLPYAQDLIRRLWHEAGDRLGTLRILR